MKKKATFLQKNQEKFEGIQHEIDSLDKDIELIQENIEEYKEETQNHQRIYQEELNKEEEMNGAMKNFTSKMKFFY